MHFARCFSRSELSEKLWGKTPAFMSAETAATLPDNSFVVPECAVNTTRQWDCQSVIGITDGCRIETPDVIC